MFLQVKFQNRCHDIGAKCVGHFISSGNQLCNGNNAFICFKKNKKNMFSGCFKQRRLSAFEQNEWI